MNVSTDVSMELSVDGSMDASMYPCVSIEGKAPRVCRSGRTQQHCLLSTCAQSEAHLIAMCVDPISKILILCLSKIPSFADLWVHF